MLIYVMQRKKDIYNVLAMRDTFSFYSRFLIYLVWLDRPGFV